MANINRTQRMTTMDERLNSTSADAEQDYRQTFARLRAEIRENLMSLDNQVAVLTRIPLIKGLPTNQFNALMNSLSQEEQQNLRAQRERPIADFQPLVQRIRAELNTYSIEINYASTASLYNTADTTMHQYSVEGQNLLIEMPSIRLRDYVAEINQKLQNFTSENTALLVPNTLRSGQR